jgi:hypothetical protein
MRGTEAEKDRMKALTLNQKSIDDLLPLITDLNLARPALVEFVADPQTGERVVFKSTIGREISFASHHSTHHISMIRMLMETMGYSLPSDFGLANSTILFIQTDTHNPK